MEKSIITEGKTTNEAIEKGLKQLGVGKNKVNIKVLENEDKRSFFSILTPRVVKVELTLKESKVEINTRRIEKVEVKLTEEENILAKENIKKFLDEFLNNLSEDSKYNISNDELGIRVEINGKNLGYLIGYRGETLYSIQTILSTIANKGISKRVKVILDIEGYKEKRIKTLEQLAIKNAKRVIKTKKSIRLEPMQAYERKIIHSKLQEIKEVETNSIGEEPYRKIVISYKK